MTILLTPFMSCSAKLPIYSLFAAAFFPQYAGLVMVLLYFTGIVVGVLAALLLKSTVFNHSIYCRENALYALYAGGQPEHVGPD